MEIISLLRPPVDPKRMWVKCILMLICFALGMVLIITSFCLADDYRIRAARAIELPAVITHVEKVYRGDTTDYDVYVAYEYKGVQYSEWYVSSPHESQLDRVGEQVKIVVDSENPDVQIEDLTSGYFFAFFFGMPIFALGFGLLAINSRKTYVESYGMTNEARKADQIMEDRRRILWLPMLVYSVGNIIWGICLRNLDGIFWGAILIGVIIMPIWIALMVRYIRNVMVK